MDDLDYWLRITSAQGIGPVSVQKLLSYFDNSPSDVFKASSTTLRDTGLNQSQIYALTHIDTSDLFERTCRWLEIDKHHIIPISAKEYPERLKAIYDPPALLYVIGDPEVLKTAQVAIVGSRKPTPSAARSARVFAKNLGQRGITVTSGLALGVDAEAHWGSLDADALTIAVAATGLDRVYPARHQTLARKISENGAIVSEFGLGTPIKASFFPRRNRIISGLSLATLVVEAALRSGSLTTARHAMEQNREVLAIPGSIHNPLAKGCHQLLRQGAKLVETIDDILEELSMQIVDFKNYLDDSDIKTTENSRISLNPKQEKLVACLDFSPKTIDTLIECSGLQASEVAPMLLTLQLEGIVDVLSGNRYTRSD